LALDPRPSTLDRASVSTQFDQFRPLTTLGFGQFRPSSTNFDFFDRKFFSRHFDQIRPPITALVTNELKSSGAV